MSWPDGGLLLAPVFAATPGEPASCDLQLQRTSKLRSSSSWRYLICSKIKMEPGSNPFCQLCECLSQVPDARDSHRSPQPIPDLRGERHFGLKSCLPGWAVRPCKSRSLDPTNVQQCFRGSAVPGLNLDMTWFFRRTPSGQLNPSSGPPSSTSRIVGHRNVLTVFYSWRSTLNLHPKVSLNPKPHGSRGLCFEGFGHGSFFIKAHISENDLVSSEQTFRNSLRATPALFRSGAQTSRPCPNTPSAHCWS